jgi:glycosyltransferase involved in cell wall biosynthesis
MDVNLTINRLCLLSNSAIPSKYANSIQVMKMAEAFSELGIDVTLRGLFALKTWLIARIKKEWPDDYWDFYGVRPNFRIIRLINPRIDINGYLSPQLIRFSKYDLVITRNLLAANLLVNYGVPTLYELHDLEHDLQNRHSKPLLGRDRDSSLLGIISISQVMGDKLIQLGFPIEKLMIAHDGVNLGQFAPNFSKSELREQIGLPPNDFIALYSGQRYAADNRLLLTQCASNLPHITFCVLGGSSDDLREFKELIELRKIPNIHLQGYVPNSLVPKFLMASDLLLMPYSDKIANSCMSPLKMFEYMASRTPIISTDLPQIREVLINDKNAVLVEPDNLDRFIEAIPRIAQDTTLGKQLGEQAFIDVQQYDWKSRAHRIIEFAEDRLSKRLKMRNTK